MKKYFFSLALLMAGSGLFATIGKENKDLEMQRALRYANLYEVRRLIRSGYDVNIASCGDKFPVNAAITSLYALNGLNSSLTYAIEAVNEVVNNSVSALELSNRVLRPSLDLIEKNVFSLSEIGIELLDHDSKIKKDLSEKLEEITSDLCQENHGLLHPQEKQQPTFCPALREFLRKYKQRLAEQEQEKEKENIEKK